LVAFGGCAILAGAHHARETTVMSEKILTQQSGKVLTITLNRPEVRNALDQESTVALAAAFRAFEADDQARVAVLTGAGGAFCAGADLKEMAHRTDYNAWAGDPEGPLYGRLSKPIIAAIAGHACAGGLGLALFCDIRIVDPGASFGVFSRRWGVPMSDGTTVRLPRLIGMGPAMDMLLTGRAVDAEEAVRLGLASRISAPNQVLSAAQDLAARMAEFPQVAMNSDRASMHEQQGLELIDALLHEKAHAEAAKQQEAQSGASQFAGGAGRGGAFKDPL
jgi:enoyl-CoA hydratase